MESAQGPGSYSPTYSSAVGPLDTTKELPKTDRELHTSNAFDEDKKAHNKDRSSIPHRFPFTSNQHSLPCQQTTIMDDRHSLSDPRPVPGLELPTWEVDVCREGIAVMTLRLNEETLPPRCNKKKKVVWKLPDSLGGKQPSFGTDEKRRIWDLFKEQKKLRRKSKKQVGDNPAQDTPTKVTPIALDPPKQEDKTEEKEKEPAKASIPTPQTQEAETPSSSKKKKKGENKQKAEKERDLDLDGNLLKPDKPETEKNRKPPPPEPRKPKNGSEIKVSNISPPEPPKQKNVNQRKSSNVLPPELSPPTKTTPAPPGLSNTPGIPGKAPLLSRSSSLPSSGPQHITYSQHEASSAHPLPTSSSPLNQSPSPSLERTAPLVGTPIPPPGFKPPGLDNHVNGEALPSPPIQRTSSQTFRPTQPAFQQPQPPKRYLTIPPHCKNNAPVALAQTFVDIYYPLLSQGSIELLLLYTLKAQKSLSVGGAHHFCMSNEERMLQIQSFQGSRWEVRGAVAQTSIAGSVCLLVTGVCQTKLGEEVLSFCHSITLVPESEGAYQIHNDALAFLTNNPTTNAGGGATTASSTNPTAQEMNGHHAANNTQTNYRKMTTAPAPNN